jgi:amino acid transporter
VSEQDFAEHTKPEEVPVALRKGSFFGTLKAVAWSFLGIRKNSDYQNDLAKLNPLHIIAVAIVMVMMMVLGLIALVNVVVAK